MIDGNTVIFGYGDVGIFTSPLFRRMQLWQLVNTYDVGTCVLNEPIQQRYVELKFDTVKDAEKLMFKLREVKENNGGIIHYEDVVLDFSTNYVEGSVDVVIRNVDAVLNNIISLSAC